MESNGYLYGGIDVMTQLGARDIPKHKKAACNCQYEWSQGLGLGDIVSNVKSDVTAPTAMSNTGVFFSK